MATNAKKAVLSAVLNTWERGDALLPLLTDVGNVTKGGDSLDIGYMSAPTVNTTESASVATTTHNADQLVVDRPKFINQEITQAQYAQLMNGDGKFAANLAVAGRGSMQNSVDRDVIEYLVRSVAAASSNHFNLDGGALATTDVDECEAVMREQDGIANTDNGLFWFLSPRAMARLKNAGLYTELATPMRGEVGRPILGRVNGIPSYTHNGVPGGVNRLDAATTGVTVATNVATATVAAGHGFVAGQLIYTSGLTSDIPVTSPVAITSVTATTIVYPLTAGDGALADGVGTIFSASAYALLCYGPWIFYGFDGVIPRPDLVKREDDAGWTWQLFQHMGRIAHAGACMVLHTPD